MKSKKKLPSEIIEASVNYYNEFDPYAAEWLQNLIDAGLIPKGIVDDRDIRTIKPKELDGYDHCHFFAGIGGWPNALRLAGWPKNRKVWTGSCPCQPFSITGKNKGTNDERHLWPAFRWFIAQCRPSVVFGEQVASKAGRKWLAGVRADLEALGYAVGAADLCSAGVNSPNIRQRLYWVADLYEARRSRTGKGFQINSEQRLVEGCNPLVGGLVNGICMGLEGLTGHEYDRNKSGRLIEKENGSVAETGFWSDFDLVYCRDDKVRRIESGTFPLAHGLPRSVGPGSTKQQRMELLAAKANRKGRLKGYGNAINPYITATFIKAYMEIIE
jgi:DNA (cytosine-5)-methyltransferase 1